MLCVLVHGATNCMMRTRTDQTIFSPLGLVCILMVYMFCNLSDASTLGDGVGGLMLLCALLERVQISLFFLFFSPSIGFR